MKSPGGEARANGNWTTPGYRATASRARPARRLTLPEGLTRTGRNPDPPGVATGAAEHPAIISPAGGTVPPGPRMLYETACGPVGRPTDAGCGRRAGCE